MDPDVADTNLEITLASGFAPAPGHVLPRATAAGRALHRAAEQARQIAATVRPVSDAYEQVRHLLQDANLQVPELADAVRRLQQEHARTLALISFEHRAASLGAKAAVRDAGARIAAFIAEQACQLSAWARERAADLRALRSRVDEEAARLGLA